MNETTERMMMREDAPDVIEFERGALRVEVRGPRWLVEAACAEVSFFTSQDEVDADAVIAAVGGAEGLKRGGNSLRRGSSIERGEVSLTVYAEPEVLDRYDPDLAGDRQEMAEFAEMVATRGMSFTVVRDRKEPAPDDDGPQEYGSVVGFGPGGMIEVRNEDSSTTHGYATVRDLVRAGWMVVR